jgi:hypothetical protein
VSISILPDLMSATERAAIVAQSALVNGIDVNPDLKYSVKPSDDSDVEDEEIKEN